MESELSIKLENFRAKVAKAGEDVVFRQFPRKIIELSDLVDAFDSPASPFHSSNALRQTDTTVYPPPAQYFEGFQGKKRKLDDAELNAELQKHVSEHPKYPELVKANEHLTTKIHPIIKKESEELAQLVEHVRLWVTLTLPRIEDGDNFGVHVQEEVLGELQRAQESALSLRDVSRQDHLTRAKIGSKLVKYPNLEDYTLALRDHDEKQFFVARQSIHDLRSVYASITDMMHKNISKIRVPKNNNSVALY
ncbi:proteasome activator pa28 REG alpha beta subunit [Coprinopsis marcescibilis]|uniref:Proteasome activator pa28 REG alpha beta subunit n=1 Tax=Coprinopsis marcescibilis TaxID=230819 RepID=A0A5C3LDK5_COPMA|nr:proteasome activator pa28 REG alpha beta subunit [Coprinopsis marcescibilis]